MINKICASCLVDKPIEEFTAMVSRNSFKKTGTTHHSYCKVCNALRAKTWRINNPSYVGTGRVKTIPLEDRVLMSAIRHRLKDARSRCKKFNKIGPTVTDQELYDLFITQQRKCALTQAPLNWEIGHPLCLSLDQIDPSEGYQLGNVQWLAWCVNRAKGDLSLQDFYEMCEVISYQKVQRLSKSSES